MLNRRSYLSFLVAAAGLAGAAQGQVIIFSTNDTDLRLASAARVPSASETEVETADDFVLTTDTQLSGGKIMGLGAPGTPLSHIERVVVQIYRVFPLDSDTARMPRVPSRANSPSDTALKSFDSEDHGLTFIPSTSGISVTALNSVVNGINPLPNQTTNGEGPVAGDEVSISFQLASPIDLPPGHYFLVPQVHLKAGTFHWLSAPKPIVAPGTPFTGDLQAWVRSSRLSPDWLRIGTDIVGGTPAPTFNMVFFLKGPERCAANGDASPTPPILRSPRR